jgi:hypothetical protein
MTLSRSLQERLGLDRAPLNERDRLRQEVYRRLAEHGPLLADVEPMKLSMIIMQSWSWRWNIEEIGRAIVHEGTRHEEYSALAGFHAAVAMFVEDYRNVVE